LESKAFLKHGGYANVIVLDWGSLSGYSPNDESRDTLITGAIFLQVLGNLGRVGSRLGDFIHYLQTEKNIPSSNIHLVGMSLGAHIGKENHENGLKNEK